MPRLFVAVDVPDEIGEQLAAMQDPSLPARWTPVHQFHLTLRFIGDVPDVQAESIRHALDGVATPDFSMHVEGVGVFPSIRKPRVVWAGLSNAPLLGFLYEEVNVVVERFIPNVDAVPFHPHITLCRMRRPDARGVRAFLRTHKAFATPVFPVNQFHLYASLLHPDGARHVRLASFELGARLEDEDPSSDGN